MLSTGILDSRAAGDSAVAPAVPSEFERDLQQALAGPGRSISPKYFYDAEGSRLFDRICELPEYYPTRTEMAILADHAREMADVMGPSAQVVEFGAGSCAKVGLLLEALERPAGYLPIDISTEHLVAAAVRLRRAHPGLDVQPMAADYTQPLALPPLPAQARRRVGFFPGSTLGNFSPPEARQFLRRAAQLLRGGGLLLGADLVKDPAVLHAAYNDSQGVTAAFNLNLLARANRELGTQFALDAFFHSAFYNAPQRRIEMHLVSRTRQVLRVGGQSHVLEEGEALHTENSHKFTIDSLRALASEAGFVPGAVWTDPQQLFCVHWLAAPH